MTVLIRTIKPEDYPAVRHLHWNHYWRSHSLILNQDFYEWQFISPPGSLKAGGDQSIVAVDADNRLLSYLGLVPMPVTFDSKQISGAHLITWLSDPETRGKGIGMQLMEHVIQKYDFLFGRSVTPTALSVYQRLGYRYFTSCLRWVAILDPNSATAFAVNPTDSTRKRAEARAIKIDRSIDYHVSDLAPDGAEDLSTMALSKSLTFMRTNEYFIWRYEQHPFYKYKFIFLNNSKKTEGIAVVRIEQVDRRNGKVLRVLEFISPENKKIKLAKAVFSYGIENHCSYVDLFGISEHYISGFISAGGFNSIEEENLLLPHLLQPWDSDVQPPGLLFWGRRGISGIPEASLVDDVTKIYISKGDGNMDWPHGCHLLVVIHTLRQQNWRKKKIIKRMNYENSK